MRVFTLITRGILLVVWAGWFCATPHLCAEPKSKKGKSSEPPPAEEFAQFRIWKDVLSKDDGLKITLRQGKKTAAEIKLPQGPQFLEYQKIPAGTFAIEITGDGEGASKIASTTVSVDADDFVTFLVRDKKGKADLDVIDDTTESAATSGELTVRTFAHAIDMLQIKIGEDISLKLTGSRPYAHLRGLPREVIQVGTGGTDARGKQVGWTNEIDFRKVSRATLLIVPDAYGRVRPRVAIDGTIP